MNKRMKKKQSTRPRGLSQEEKLVLELYRKCDNVHFFKYDETNALDCLAIDPGRGQDRARRTCAPW